jgi:alpha-L-rhamnosidase
MKVLSAGQLRCEYKENPLGTDVWKPRFSWQLQSDVRGTMQTAYQVQAAKEASFTILVWDTGRVESDQSIQVVYGGEELQSRTRYYYRVKVWNSKGEASEWSETAWWETALLASEEWKTEWITPGIPEMETCPLLRTTFESKGKIKAARIYTTSQGLYELHLNGSKVGDYLLTPGWTSYNKRLQYQTYDVTDMVGEGWNALGVILGSGWYKGNMGWNHEGDVYGNILAALVQLHIQYEDGSESVVTSDNSWKCATSPILMSEIYNGETYDARCEKQGWSTAGYDDAEWSEVAVLNQTKEILVAQENLPTKMIEEIKPVRLFTTPAGETVLDMGQNMVGWMRFCVEAEAGSRIVLQHSEILDSEGNLYFENLRSAKQTITYIFKGEGKECFEPHFTFQGFQYVKLVEYPGTPVLENFIGRVVHSALEPTGSFACSNEMVNQLQHNILWGQKGNFVDVPTDCPQRDERLGWTGDVQMFARTACFNMSTAPFFTKWLRDLKADQFENGGVPFVIPHVLGVNDHSSAAWGDSAVMVPWTLYLCYGDERILAEQYDSMKAWVEYIRGQGENEFLWNTGFHFGDWVALDAKEGSFFGATPNDLIATAFYAYSTRLLAKTAEILGNAEDKKVYEALYENIVEAFRKEFVTPGGRLVSPTQTGYIVPLMFDLMEEKDKQRTVDTLVNLLEENKIHLTTGFVGTPYLCHVLSNNGRSDIAYKLLLQTDYPSWLYQVTKGATTVWEHWDGLKPDGTFWSRDMNSFNHYAYGSIGEWLYRVVAGIDTDEAKPGYKHILIRPQPGAELAYAKAGLQTMYGLVKSEWEKADGRMKVKVTVPPNTTATVILPGAVLEQVLESGTDVRTAAGVDGFEQVQAGVKLEVGSGEYCFEYAFQ